MRRGFLYGFLRDPAGMGAELASETIPLMVAPGLETAVRAGAQASGRLPADRIEVPTLLVWGRHDRILRLELAEHLAATIPHARLEVIDEAAHAPMFERPDEFNAVVGGFLSVPASLGGELMPFSMERWLEPVFEPASYAAEAHEAAGQAAIEHELSSAATSSNAFCVAE